MSTPQSHSILRNFFISEAKQPIFAPEIETSRYQKTEHDKIDFLMDF